MKKNNQSKHHRNFRSGRFARRALSMLCAVMVLMTSSPLALAADSLEGVSTRGVEAHAHEASCYDENGQLVCGLDAPAEGASVLASEFEPAKAETTFDWAGSDEMSEKATEKEDKDEESRDEAKGEETEDEETTEEENEDKETEEITEEETAEEEIENIEEQAEEEAEEETKEEEITEEETEETTEEETEEITEKTENIEEQAEEEAEEENEDKETEETTEEETENIEEQAEEEAEEEAKEEETTEEETEETKGTEDGETAEEETEEQTEETTEEETTEETENKEEQAGEEQAEEESAEEEQAEENPAEEESAEEDAGEAQPEAETAEAAAEAASYEADIDLSALEAPYSLTALMAQAGRAAGETSPAEDEAAPEAANTPVAIEDWDLRYDEALLSVAFDGTDYSVIPGEDFVSAALVVDTGDIYTLNLLGRGKAEQGPATITAADGGVLPEGARASARAVPETEFDEALNLINAQGLSAPARGRMKLAARPGAASNAVGLNSETKYRAFDIALNNAEGYEGGFHVDVALDAPVTGRDFHLYHIHDGQMTELELEQTEGTIGHLGFDTPDFSLFVFSYTVDFYYGEYEYHLNGGGNMLLSELFALLKIDRDAADAVSVTFSAPQLMAVEPVDGDWRLTSLQAFDTEETLTVVMENGDRFAVRVTDAATNAHYTVNDNTMGSIYGRISNGNPDPSYKRSDNSTVAASHMFFVPENGYEFVAVSINEEIYNSKPKWPFIIQSGYYGIYYKNDGDSKGKALWENATDTLQVKAYFKPIDSYILNYVAETGGTVSRTEDFATTASYTSNGVTATAADGYEFDGWWLNETKLSDNATLTSDDLPASKFSADFTEITAKFKKTAIEITYTVNEHGSVHVNGASDGASEMVSNGAAPKGAAATPETNYSFVYWIDTTHGYVVSREANFIPENVTEDTTYQAWFKPTKTARAYLMVSDPEKGTITRGGDNYNYLQLGGNAIGGTYSAKPIGTYKFSYWERNGQLYSTDASLPSSTPIDANPVFYIAVFTDETGHLIGYKADANGTVTNSADYTSAEISGSTAVPNEGYIFIGWYDASDDLVPSEANFVPGSSGITGTTIYTAKFDRDKKFNYSVAVNESGWGSVQKESDQTSFVGVHETSSTVEGAIKEAFAPVAANGYKFSHWELDGEKLDNEGAIDSGTVIEGMRDDSVLTAVFVPENTDFVVNYVSGGNGTVSLAKSYYSNTDPALLQSSTATASAGYAFVGWYDEDERLVSKEAEFKPEAVTADVTFTARFGREYTIRYEWSTASGKDFTADLSITSETATRENGAQGVTASTTDSAYVAYWYEKGNGDQSYLSSDNTFVPVGEQIKETTYVAYLMGSGGGRIIFDANNDSWGYVTSGDYNSNGGRVTNPDKYVGVNANTAKVIKAHPSEGYKFGHWEIEKATDVAKREIIDKISGDAIEAGWTFKDCTPLIRAVFVPENSIEIAYQAQEGGSVSNSVDYYADEMTIQGSTAKPDRGYVFAGWYLDDVLISEEPDFVPGDVFTAPVTYTAWFTPLSSVVITYQVDNENNYKAENHIYMANGADDNKYVINEVVYENETPVGAVAVKRNNNSWKFFGWTDEEGRVVCLDETFVPSGNLVKTTTYTANFKENVVRMMITVNDHSYGTIERGGNQTDKLIGYSVDEAGKIKIGYTYTATPAEGYEFDYWKLNGDRIEFSASGINNVGVAPDPSRAVQVLMAVFKPAGSHLISYEATEGGSISNDEDYISPSVEVKGSTATPDEYYVFDGWYYNNSKIQDAPTITNDDLQSLNLTDDSVVTAKFSLNPVKPYTVKVEPDDAYGLVTDVRDGEKREFNGAHETNTDSEIGVAITAEAKENTRFDHWELRTPDNTVVLLGNDVTLPTDTAIAVPNSVIVAIFEKTGSYTIHYEAEGGGGVSNTIDHPINSEDEEGVKGSKATPYDGNRFAGWFEKVESDGEVKYFPVKNADVDSYSNEVTASTFKPSGDQIKDGATYVAMFRPGKNQSKGIVGYNMNLNGVDVSWRGEKDVIYTTSYGAIVYCENKDGEYYEQDDTITVTDVVPTAPNYAFVTWFDKTRTKNQEVESEAAMRNAGDQTLFITGDDETYTFDAIWVQGKAEDIVVPYDQKGHMIEASIELVLGAMTSDERWSDELKEFKDSFGIKKNDSGEDDITYKVIKKDGVDINDGEQDFIPTDPGVYTVQARFTVEYRKKDENTPVRYQFNDVEATVTILPKTVTIVKEWDDRGQTELRPDGLTVNVTGSDNSVFTTGTWTKQGNTWVAKVENLPFKNGDDLVEYTVSEEVPVGYSQIGMELSASEQAYAELLGDETLTNETYTITNRPNTSLLIKKTVVNLPGTHEGTEPVYFAIKEAETGKYLGSDGSLVDGLGQARKWKYTDFAVDNSDSSIPVGNQRISGEITQADGLREGVTYVVREFGQGVRPYDVVTTHSVDGSAADEDAEATFTAKPTGKNGDTTTVAFTNTYTTRIYVTKEWNRNRQPLDWPDGKTVQFQVYSHVEGQDDAKVGAPIALGYNPTDKKWNVVPKTDLQPYVLVGGVYKEAQYYAVECDDQGEAIGAGGHSIVYKNGHDNNPSAGAVDAAIHDDYRQNDADRTITIVNYDTLLTVQKIDKVTRKPLTGATFKLEKKGNDGGFAAYTVDNANGSYAVAEDGTIALTLPDGDYRLRETDAPIGYKPPAEAFAFTVSNGTIGGVSAGLMEIDAENRIITIENEPGAEFPTTGGAGTAGYYAAGSALMLLALALVLRRKREY